MTQIAYLLHRFPAKTDTFIKREIRSLQNSGTDVHIISVWKPRAIETTPEILAEWSADTLFIFPRSISSIVGTLVRSLTCAPRRFLDGLRVALATSRPGLRGLAYQLAYFLEAILAADSLRRIGATHVHNHIGDQSGTVTMLAARLAGITYSISFHGWPVFFDAKYSRIKEKVRGAKFTRSISYFCRSQLMMFSECDNSDLFKVVHCGISPDRYHYRPPTERVERIFCAARLAPEKGHSFLIHALKILRDNGHEIELRLGGDGPSRAQLVELTEQLGLSDRIHFLGHLSEDDIIGHLQASDLFVLPSFVEGIPVAVMEAMAIGVPVISTNIAGTSELIEDGKTGVLVRPSDAQALVNAIIRMKTDYEFRLSTSTRGRTKVVDEFDVHKETAKLAKCFREL